MDYSKTAIIGAFEVDGPNLSAPIVGNDRRADLRARTVYRIAQVRTRDDHGLARVLNISDEGLGLQLHIPVMLNDSISVHLSEDVVVHGRVAWTNGPDCGLQLASPIDSQALLHHLALQSRSSSGRPLRLPMSKTAVSRSELGLRRVEVQDVSQHGMKIRHDGKFSEGLQVKVSLGSGTERRGVVRWSRDGIAGLILLQPFTTRELGSMNNF
jgi:hypothetical protein